MVVLLGSNGNITSQLARRLLASGSPVRVVGRSAAHLAPLREAGAQLAIGDIADRDFLTGALRGADAAYLMIPPAYGAPDMLDAAARLGEAIAAAAAASGVKRLVNLSSIGAHLPTGTGPIVSLHAQEQRLNAIDGIDLLHLRPGYFFENHLAAIEPLRRFGVFTDTNAPDVAVPSIATADVAAVAARELQAADAPRAGGPRVLHLRSAQMLTPSQSAAILGSAIGRPELRHVRADPAQAKAGMIAHGFSAHAADLMIEMSQAFGRPQFRQAEVDGPTELTPTRLEDFAPIFKRAFELAA